MAEFILIGRKSMFFHVFNGGESVYLAFYKDNIQAECYRLDI